jgi:hypothetical protein
MRAWLLFVGGLGGCSQLGLWPGAPPAGTLSALAGRPALTVVLADDVPDAARVRDALRTGLGETFDLRFGELPAAAPQPAPDAEIDLRLAAARKQYVDANFAPCIATLSAEALVPDLLGRGRRLEAARVLLWRAACRVGLGKLTEARGDGATLVALGLDVPPDVAAVSPEVEHVFTEAGRAAEARARAPLKIAAQAGARARVAVDGRADACVAPCTIDLLPGDHVLRMDADGFAPDVKVARVPGPDVAFTLAPAPPQLAAHQWSLRYARGPALDSAPSVGLLATATRSRSLALLTVEAGRQKLLRGVLALDGEVAARSERPIADSPDDEAPALVRDLLVRGRLLEPAPPIWQKPLFWVVVGSATIAAAGVTALILYQPPVQTTVHF